MTQEQSELLACIRSFRQHVMSELDRLEGVVISSAHSQPKQPAPNATDRDEWMTAKETCKCLKISETTFYEYIRQGLLPPGFELGPRSKRWRMSDIEVWQKSSQNHGGIRERHNVITKRRGRISRVRKIGEFCHA